MPDHALQPVRAAAFAALDFESAGARKGETDEVVQVGVAVCDGLDWANLRMFRTYVRPAGKVAWTASRVHGIAAETVSGAPLFTELWPVLRGLLGGRVVVAHGAATEKRHLRKFPLHGFGPWIDTLPWARAVWPEAGSHRLEDAVAAAGEDDRLRRLVPTIDWHDALFDAVATLVLLRRAVEITDAWDLPVHRLDELRRGGRRP